MNVERINAVADAIEQHSVPGLGFNMNYFRAEFVADMEPTADKTGQECGTVACIAGWAHTIGKTEDTFSAAAEWLGLDPWFGPIGTSEQLFLASNAPDEPQYKLDQTTAAQAVRTLRHLAATGKVDWTV